jgi:hypothetical protein
MPLAGKGMLLTSMDVDPANEAEFSQWYDREHLEERVATDGFLEARRYLAHQGNPKNLFLYSTATIDVLDSPAYRARLANPTDLSRKNMAHFKNMIRVVARITLSRGKGRGAVLGIMRLRPSVSGEDELRAVLRQQLDPGELDGIISMHLLESDSRLSGPTSEVPVAAGAGANDWFVLVDGTSIDAVSATLAALFGEYVPKPGTHISMGVYRLMWDLSKSDLSHS